MGADDNELEIIKTGAMLHDIGKIGMPLHILESPDRLNDADMEVMRTHVEITEKILEGSVDNDIMRIAVKHHEKLDGSGYPNRLKIKDIDFFDRIVSVADIFSALCGARSYKNAYPKEKIVGILNDMSANNLLDPGMVALSIKHFDTIIEAVNREANPVIQIYNEMNEEYRRIRNSIEGKYKGRTD
jgi:response regulator RpfG family c-di-GMP phosphodiesterase